MASSSRSRLASDHISHSLEPQAFPSMACTSIEPSPSEARPSKPRKPVSRSKKAVAAVTGAVFTSFLMTPFDVVKTRLQTQASPEPMFVPSKHIATPLKEPNAFARASAKYASVTGLNAHPATCCQPTFFTGNSQESSLTCRYDPRVQPALTSRGRFKRSAPRASLSHSGPTAFTSSTLPRSSVRILPSPPPAPNTYLHSTPSATAANGSSSSACVFPDRSVAAKELQAVAAQHGRLTGLWDGVIKVGRAEGICGLYRGLAPTLMMTVPSQVTYMTCYDYFRSFLLANEDTSAIQNKFDASQPNPVPHSPSLSAVTAHSLYASLIAGALARGISATLVTPLELVRTRLQASSRHSSSLSSILRSLVSEMRTSPSGPMILWRGLSPTLWRDVPFSAIYFAGYESGKRILTGGGLGEGNAKGSGEEFGVAFISGAVSGSIAAVVTHPFDLVKTRLQASQGEGGTRLSKTLRRRVEPTPGPFGAMRLIVWQEGWKGLFRGLSPRTAKVAPACGVMIASFEVVGRLLSEA